MMVQQETTKKNMGPADKNAVSLQFQALPLDQLMEVDRLIAAALSEDIHTGDITANSIVPESQNCVATILLKEEAVVAGLELFELVMRKCDPNAHLETFINEGDRVNKVPTSIARVEGKARAVLAAERTALNFLQRMSGIATLTREFTDKASPLGIQILDTRKTTPGLRIVEKWAVRIAGGTNHRFGLWDAILIKDNHIAIAGGVKQAVERSRHVHPDKPIEVEVVSLDMLKEALSLKVERVMLDNMSPEQIRKAIELVSGEAYIEVSGGIRLENLQDYLIPGISGISIGALTHSAKNIDISLEF